MDSIEIINLSTEFLLVVLSNSNIFLQSFVLVLEGIEFLFGEKSALGDQFLISGGHTEVEDVANSGEEVRVVVTNTFSPESGSISDNVSLNFDEEIASVRHSVAETKTSIQLAAGTVHSTSLIAAESNTSTTEHIQVTTTLGIPVVEAVVQRQQKLSGNGAMLVHRLINLLTILTIERLHTPSTICKSG